MKESETVRTYAIRTRITQSGKQAHELDFWVKAVGREEPIRVSVKLLYFGMAPARDVAQTSGQ